MYLTFLPNSFVSRVSSFLRHDVMIQNATGDVFLIKNPDENQNFERLRTLTPDPLLSAEQPSLTTTRTKLAIKLSLLFALVSASISIGWARTTIAPVIDLILQESARVEDDKNSDITRLPPDTGGQHIAKLIGSTSAAYGYYVYLPAQYDSNNLEYPLLVFLHGKGERGNGGSAQSTLDKVLRHGPPKLIKNMQWSTSYPMIVVSPQYHGTSGNRNNWGAGNPQNLKNFIQYMLDSYRINTRRVYLTGLSHGGNGVYDYLTKLEDNQSLIAAAAPIAAFGLKNGVEKSRNTPVWAFVGRNDGTNFVKTRDFYNAYNNQIPAPITPAKFTVFDGAGHDVWTRIYDRSGEGNASPDFDPFDQGLTDWFFQFKRQADNQ